MTLDWNVQHGKSPCTYFTVISKDPVCYYHIIFMVNINYCCIILSIVYNEQ